MAQSDQKDKAHFLNRLRRGDPAMFREWVRQTRPLVEGVLLSMVGDADVVQDLMQQAYIKAYGKLSSVRDPNRLQSWLAQLTRNTARDWMRRQAVKRREHDRYVRDFARAWVEPVGDGDRHQQRREQIRQLVGQLPEELREVILLRYYSGRTYQEISIILSVPMTTVDGRMRTAKKQLAELMEKDS